MNFAPSESEMDPKSQEDKPILSNEEKSQECIEISQGVSLNLIFATVVVVVGSSFQFGYNSGVINAPEAVIEEFINSSYYQRYQVKIADVELKLLWGVIVSIFAIGGMIGSFAGGYMADRLGRKKTLLLNNFIALVGVTFMGCTKLAGHYELLITGRFVIGINCGINTVVAPLFLTEIAPINSRGVLGTLNQFGIVTSMLFSQILGLPHVLGSATLWPLLLAMPVIFVVFQLITLPFCPDTPAYLLRSYRSTAALNSLQWLRRQHNVDNDMRNLRSEQAAVLEEQKVGIKRIFTTKHLLLPLLIAIVMQCSQQLSGINAVFYYSTNIFIAAGVNALYSPYVTVGMGSLNVFMVGVSIALIEKAGRRTLHLTGLAGMFVCAVILVFSLNFAVTWLSIIAVLGFVAFFQVGPGSIPWFITAELFRENARPTAISIAGLVNWTGNFIVGIGYPPIEYLIHGYTFIIFASLLAFFWIFTYLKVPETKGRSINEISNIFEQTSEHR